MPALQEAALVLGTILKRFQLIDHAGYQLKVKESLTVKPDDLTPDWYEKKMRANLEALKAAMK